MTRITIIAAAAACIVVAIGTTLVLRGTGTVYEAEPGASRVLVLADGSRAHLNARTRLRVRFGTHQRDLELLQGEAMFDVARDTWRPFRVAAHGASVEALGTQFDTKLVGNDLIVTVYHGRVAVSDGGVPGSGVRRVELTDRQTLTVHLGPQHRVASMRKLTPAEAKRAFAWTGFVELDGMPLREALERFNRANTVQLVLDDPQLAGMQLGGRVSLIDPDGFAWALRSANIARVTRRDGQPPVYHVARLPGQKT